VTKYDRLTKVFAKAGLDNVTSAMCKHQQRFGLDNQFSVLVLSFNNIFSIGHLYRAGKSMNSLPSQILERYVPYYPTVSSAWGDSKKFFYHTV